MLETQILKARLTTLDEMLGTKAIGEAGDEYVIAKAPSDAAMAEEKAAAIRVEEEIKENDPDAIQVGTTVFHRDKDGELILWDYQIKGFLKEAGNVIRQVKIEMGEDGKKKKSQWTAIKSKIDNFVFVYPREIKLGVKREDLGAVMRTGETAFKDALCTRPIRVETMRGPRVAVVSSETVPAGTTFDIEIAVLDGGPVTLQMVKMCLDYGQLKGLGQWRNSGKGRFNWVEL